MKKKNFAIYIFIITLFMNVFIVSGSIDSWAKDSIDLGVNENIIPIELRNNYKTNITREDFCMLAVHYIENFYNKPVEEILFERDIELTGSPFTDTNKKFIADAYSMGIVKGVSENKFAPKNNINREQAAVMLRNVGKFISFTENKNEKLKFSDEKDISLWAIEGVHFVSSNGIMKGTGNNLFSPKNLYSRQQAFVTFVNLYNVSSDKNILEINGKVLKLYDTENYVLETFGQEKDVLETKNWTWNVYYTNYEDLLLIGLARGKVVAIATNSGKFVFDYKIHSGYIPSAEDKYKYEDIFIMDGDAVDGIFIKSAELEHISEKAMAMENLYFTNSFRVKSRLKQFNLNDKLFLAASNHSKDMAKNSILSHKSFDGMALGKRLENTNYNYIVAGENIARGKDITGIKAYEVLINSAGHRKNILNNYKEIGVAATIGRDGRNYFTQNFGTEK